MRPVQITLYKIMIIMYFFPLVGQVSVQESEELVINTLVTFNNLSYYADLTSTDSSGLSTITEELTTGIYIYICKSYLHVYRVLRRPVKRFLL